MNASQGDRVHSGQVLAQIDSVDMDQAWSEYLKARARLELATRSVKREETLFQKKVSPEKDLLKARQEFGEAEADMLLAREKFRLLGVDVRQVEADTNGTEHNHPLIPVCAPLSGVVIEKTVTQGEMVGAGQDPVHRGRPLHALADDRYLRAGPRKGQDGMQVKLSVSRLSGKRIQGTDLLPGRHHGREDADDKGACNHRQRGGSSAPRHVRLRFHGGPEVR